MGKDAFIMVQLYGIHNAEKMAKKLYKQGKLTEKMFYALIMEIEKYY